MWRARRWWGSVQWPQDAADCHRTLFLLIFWAPLRSRQQLTMIWINAKLSRVYSSSILRCARCGVSSHRLTLRRATCHVSTVAAGQCRRMLQAAAGHYTVMLLCRLVAVIDVLRHSCGQVDWQLTEQNYTYSKNSNNITINSVLRRSVATCGVLRSL